jgi:hypothetical protein
MELVLRVGIPKIRNKGVILKFIGGVLRDTFPPLLGILMEIMILLVGITMGILMSLVVMLEIGGFVFLTPEKPILSSMLNQGYTKLCIYGYLGKNSPTCIKSEP